MRGAEILDRLSRLGIKLAVEEGRLVAYRPPDVAIPPDLAEAIRAHKAEIIRLLTEGASEAGAVTAASPSPGEAAGALVCPSCGADDLHPDDAARFGDCVQCGAKLDPAGAAAVPPRRPTCP